MSSSVNTFADPVAFLSHLRKLDEKSGHALITELFNKGVEFRSRSESYANELANTRQQVIEIQAVNTELRNELNANQTSSAELLQSSAVEKYRLSEAETLIEELKAQLSSKSDLGTSSGGANRSELFRIDEKFMGTDKSLYPSFQRQIKIALAQNADRYIGLQSQISLIYQNLGPGPKSFLDRYLADSGHFNFESLTAVWDVLDVSYRNLNEEDDAREALNGLRQSSRPFGMYLAGFQRLHNLSKIKDDKTLISCMRNGISSELRSCVSQHQDIHRTYTFDEYVTLCKDCVVRQELERPSNPKV
ncbi:hypothetical protein K3495_g4267 [Podosphaera aphanis]|nr:hypothetical protein K3495_g4267 [Podosphaera aphanis]